MSKGLIITIYNFFRLEENFMWLLLMSYVFMEFYINGNIKFLINEQFNGKIVDIHTITGVDVIDRAK